jgi:TfoX/Sxy family transcriptional regulator of competence genes
MASSLDFIEYILEQIGDAGEARYRKMFGEYVVYVDDRPILLVCDDTAYVKILPELAELMRRAEKGRPFEGAKEHYVVDIDDRELTRKIVEIVTPLTPLPKPKAKKRSLFSAR